MSKSSPQKKSPALVLMLFIAGFAGLMGYVIVHELWYSLSGKTAEANVSRQSTESRRAGRFGSRTVVVVDYSFTESGGRLRNERDEVPGNSVGEAVAVEYIPGVGGLSRVQGKPSKVSNVLIIGSMFLPTLLLVWWGIFRPRLGHYVIWLGSFILSVMCASGFSVTLVWDGTLAHSWIGILTSPVPLAFGAIGLVGLWFSSHELWRSSRPRSQEADLRADPDAPKFSADSLVCESSTGLGKPRAVIVDHAAGMIHFQNCHRPFGFWVIFCQTWLSCPLADVLRTREKTTKNKDGSIDYSFVMQTETGTATVYAYQITNYEALRQYFADRFA